MNGVKQSTSHAVPFTSEVDGIVGPLSIPGLPDEFENEKKKSSLDMYAGVHTSFN